MKIRLLLSIMLIWMISMTAFATTSKLEQKSKPTITLDQKVYVDVVNVETIDFVLNKINVNSKSEANAYFITKIESEPITYLAIITDVGWRSSKQRFTNIPYKEKLLGNSKNDLKFYKNQKQNRIRENPFAVNQSFIFKRYC